MATGGMRIMGAIKRIVPKTFSDAFRYVGIDLVTHALNVINYAHHEVHGGNSYFANYRQTLGNGDVLGIGITTPNTTKWAHMSLHANAVEECELNLYEDCTNLAGGAAKTLYNQNRNSDQTSGMVAITGGTGSNPITRTGGTLIYAGGLGAGAPIDWSRDAGEEMILKQNSIYLFEVQNGVQANIVSLTLRWYEHTDRT